MGKGDGHGIGSGAARGKQERVAVPAMPMPLAILCCILNFLVPGLGTIIAGFSACCCSRNEDMSAMAQLGSCCISFSIGLLQLLTTALLLFGWIWSCIWGVFFLGMSAEYYHDNPAGNGVVIQQPCAQIVVMQPGGNSHPRQQYPVQQQQHVIQPGFQQPFTQPQQYYPHPPAYVGGAYQSELPPPYTEREIMPTAPPAEKQ